MADTNSTETKEIQQGFFWHERKTHKRCSHCGIQKPVTEFNTDKRKKDGFYSCCRHCHLKVNRASHLQRNYGIDSVIYVEMHKAQNGACPICGTVPEKKRLYVDHDHETGQPRALLCMNCNTALGHFRDDVELLRIAITYLEYWREKHKELSE